MSAAAKTLLLECVDSKDDHRQAAGVLSAGLTTTKKKPRRNGVLSQLA